MIHPWLPVRMSIPLVLAMGLKKSKMLLLSMRLPVFTVLFPAVPTAEMHFVGRLAPAGPILLLLTILLLLPTMLVPDAVVVLKRTFPPEVPTATVDDPRIEQFRTMLFCAPAMKRIVLVSATAPVFVFDKVSVPP